MIQQIEYNGWTEYKLNDMLHRPNGPARIWKYTGDWTWYLFDELHRYYGYTRSYGYGWFIHGRRINEI